MHGEGTCRRKMITPCTDKMEQKWGIFPLLSLSCFFSWEPLVPYSQRYECNRSILPLQNPTYLLCSGVVSLNQLPPLRPYILLFFAEDKASVVRSLQAQGEVVVVVGDGANDAPALAAADVGVSMKSGTGAAMDTADVVLMRDDVGGAGMAVDVSRLTMRKVRCQMVFCFHSDPRPTTVVHDFHLLGWPTKFSVVRFYMPSFAVPAAS